MVAQPDKKTKRGMSPRGAFVFSFIGPSRRFGRRYIAPSDRVSRRPIARWDSDPGYLAPTMDVETITGLEGGS